MNLVTVLVGVLLLAVVPGEVSGAEALVAEVLLLPNLPLQEIPRLLHSLFSTRDSDYNLVLVINISAFDPALALNADAVDPVTPVPDDAPRHGLVDCHGLLLMLPDYLLQEKLRPRL